MRTRSIFLSICRQHWLAPCLPSADTREAIKVTFGGATLHGRYPHVGGMVNVQLFELCFLTEVLKSFLKGFFYNFLNIEK